MKKIIKLVLKKPERGCDHYDMKVYFHILYIVGLLMMLLWYIMVSIEARSAFRYIFHYIMFTIMLTSIMKFEELIEYMKEIRKNKGDKVFKIHCLIFSIICIVLIIIMMN